MSRGAEVLWNAVLGPVLVLLLREGLKGTDLRRLGGAAAAGASAICSAESSTGGAMSLAGKTSSSRTAEGEREDAASRRATCALSTLTSVVGSKPASRNTVRRLFINNQRFVNCFAG